MVMKPTSQMPKAFPKRSTVSYSFQKWTKSGVLARINDILRRQVRTTVEGRAHAEATAEVIDTQSIKSTEAGGPERGFDGGKLVSGRKRNLLVDTLGLLITAVVLTVMDEFTREGLALAVDTSGRFATHA